jgi:RHH-type transcriptional regulator, rel operon repressor / antitoxin RelB
MADSAVITVRLSADLKERLDTLATSTKRSRSVVAAEAIAAYLDLHAWQIAEIEQGIKEADAGDFMTDEELAEAYRRWTS